jgi:hypothetical protein
VQYEIKVIQEGSEGRVLFLVIAEWGLRLWVSRNTYHYTKDEETHEFKRAPEEWFLDAVRFESFPVVVQEALTLMEEGSAIRVKQGDVFHCELDGKNYTWVADGYRCFSHEKQGDKCAIRD